MNQNRQAMYEMQTKIGSIVTGILLIGLLWLFPGYPLAHSAHAAGNTYYVATSGRDTNPGTLTSPFQTIPRGINAMGAGDTLYVRSGTYPSFSVTKSGTAGNYLTISGYNGEKPHVSGGTGIRLLGVSYVALKGFEITGVSSSYGAAIFIKIDGGRAPRYNLVQDNLIHDNMGSKTHGVIIDSGLNNTIVKNTIYNNYSTGIRVQSNSGPATGNEIIDNIVYHHVGDPPNSDGIAVSLPNTSQTLIKNNIVYDNADDGIDTWSSHNNTIMGNIVYGQRGGGDGNGIKLGGTETGGHNTVIGNLSYNNKADGFESNRNGGNIYYNNVAYGNGSTGFHDSEMISSCTIATCRSILINNIGYNNNRNLSASQFTAVSHNNIWSSDSGNANIAYQGIGTFSTLAAFYAASGNRLDNPNAGTLASIQQNPLFVNAAGGNFNLQANSPAINKGDPANPGGIGTVGIPDIGAHEFGGTGAGFTPAPTAVHTTVPSSTPTAPSPTHTPASPTPTQTSPSPTPTGKPGDANGDGLVNSLDFVKLFENFGTSTTLGPLAGDFDANGKVNALDYVLLFTNYGS